MALLASTLITDLQDQIGSLNAAGQAVLLKFVQRAVDRVYQFRRWSWRRITDQFTTTAPYTTGTVSVTAGSTAVTGVDSVWTDISGYATGTFYIELNSELHLISSITDATNLVLAAGVDTAVSGDTYSIYSPVTRLDSTLAELTYIGSDGCPEIQIKAPGLAYEMNHQITSNPYAYCASLTSLDSSKNRGILLWPFPSERRLYHYTGYIEPPTLLTTTDVGCPDDFRDVIEELTLARWYRRRDNDEQRADKCFAAGEKLLKELWIVDPKDSSSVPFMGGRRNAGRTATWAGELWRQ